MGKLKTLFTVICVFILAGTTNAQDVQQWDIRGGWKVRYNASPEFWRLYHNDQEWRSTTSILWADRRQDISLEQAFEQARAKHAKIDNCPALLTADIKTEYEPFAKAMLALTKIKDPEAYAKMDKDIPIIGYEVVDDTKSPHCVLIAREFQAGAMLYTVIKDDTDRLSTKLIAIRNAIHVLMDDINEREAPKKPKTKPVPAAPDKNTEIQCEGQRVYKDWVVTWSPKSAAVYVRNPVTSDVSEQAAKTLRLAVSVGGKIVVAQGRDELYYSFTISAEENGKAIIPEKRALSVDGKMVQEWGKGGGQWAALSDSAVAALLSGESAELNTTELGSIRFDLDGLETLLKRADVSQQLAVNYKSIGKCP